MEKILKYINDYLQKLEIENCAIDKNIAFLEEFFNEYKLINRDILLNSDRIKLLTTLIIFDQPNINVDDAYKIISDNKEYLLHMTEKQLDLMIEASEYKSNFSIIDKIIEFIYEKRIGSLINVYKFYKMNKINLRSLEDNVRINQIDNVMKNPEGYFSAYKMVIGELLGGRTKKKLIDEVIKNKCNCDFSLEHLRNARHYYETKIKEYHEIEKRKHKMKNSCKNLLSCINKTINRNDIIEYHDNIFGKIEDEEFKMTLLQYIYTYNKSIYDELDKRYKKLSNNLSLNYKAIFSSYNIDISDDNLEKIIKKYNKEKLECIIKLLKLKGFDSKDIVLEIILTSDLETVEYLFSLIEQGIISKELLLNNLSVFNKDLPIYKNFIKILNIFKERNINPSVFVNSQYIYLTDINILINNIDILIDHNLFSLIRSTEFYNFFNAINLGESISSLIDLKLIQYLESDLTILNYYNKFKRLKVLNILHPISSKDELINVLNQDKFFIPDSMIDRYIDDITYSKSLK